MSSNQDGTWENHDGGAQRGPSFEDPSQPAMQPSPSPVPEQDWDQGWGSGGATPHWATGQWSEHGQTAAGSVGPAGDGAQFPQAYPYPSPPDAAPHGSPAGEQPGAPWGAQYQGGQNPYAAQPYPYPGPYAQPNPYGQANPYQQPYGSYAPYGTYAYPPAGKSKAAAAVLAFFLGGFGAHSFYLNQKKLGLAHLGLGVGSFVVMMVAAVLIDSAPPSVETGLVILTLAAWVLSLGNGLWALVEFVMILIKPEHELGR